MSINEQYTDAESALARAFGCTSSSCSVVCDCGRSYFVSAEGHGDFEEGALEGYRAIAEKQPDRFIECWQFDSVEMIRIGGSERVIQCRCGVARQYLKFLEDHLDGLADFIRERLRSKIGELERNLADARSRAAVMESWDRASSPEHFKGSGI